MKHRILSLAIFTALCATGPGLRSQDDAAAPAAKPVVELKPIPPIPAGTALQMLKAMRDGNAKILEQQAATLQKLEEIEKTAQTMKILGKRS